MSYLGVERLNVIGGSGASTVAVRGLSAETSLKLGAANDIITVASATNTVAAITSLLTLDGGAGANVLLLDDSGNAQGQTDGGLVGADGSRLTMASMGAGWQDRGIQFSNIASLDVRLGSGADTFKLASASVATTLSTGNGADTIIVGDDRVASSLANIKAPVALIGGAGDTLTLRSAGASTVGIGRNAAGAGLATFGPGTGLLTYSGFETTGIELGEGNDTVTVTNAVTALKILTRDGDDTVNLAGASSAVSIDLGAGTNVALLAAVTGGTVSVTGAAGGASTVVVDKSATTPAVDMAIKDGAKVGEVIVDRLFVTSANANVPIILNQVQTLDVRLGTGNDKIDIAVTAAIGGATALKLDTGASDDLVTVRSVGARTDVVTGTGTDTVTMVIPSVPNQAAADGFKNLALGSGIETLVVDNSSNTAPGGVAWDYSSQTLYATASGGSRVKFIEAASAASVQVRAGTSGADTLLVTAGEGGGDVSGTIRGNTIDLTGEPGIVRQNNPAADFGQYGNQLAAVAFNGLVAGATAYTERDLRFSTSNAAGLDVDASGSPALKSRSTGDTITLEDAGGNVFALQRMLVGGSGSITLTGTTANGAIVTRTLSASSTAVEFNQDWSALTRVTWQGSASALVDDVSAARMWSGSSTKALTADQLKTPTFTLKAAAGSSQIVIDTSRQSLWDAMTGGVIEVDNVGDAAVDFVIPVGGGIWRNTDTGIAWSNDYFGSRTSTLLFMGDLKIADGTVWSFAAITSCR